ncbi:MAG: hypothetical protein H6672_10875 [Anaerolineaceae bacterium]|nr:hypothetical protein [Anaerolineaceae bacterium]
MNAKRMMTGLILIGLLALGVTAVGAQDTTTTTAPVNFLRQVVEIMATETGLEPAEIVAQVREGSTPAEVITANGGDVEVVKAQVVSAVTEHVNTAVANGNLTQERADQILSNLDNLVTRALNGEIRPDGSRVRPVDRARVATAATRDVVQAVADETGLKPLEILRQVRAGSTLADVITTNGGSVDNVIAAAVAAATEQANTALSNGNLNQEQYDLIIERLEGTITDAVNGNLEIPLQQVAERLIGAAVVRQVADAAGMDAQSVVTELQAGKSAATILSEHGVDVNTFIDNAVNVAAERLNQQVADGNLSQDVVDQRLATLRERLTGLLNRTFSAASGA